MGILDQQITSLKTAGEQHFSPFVIDDDLVKKAENICNKYQESSLSAVLPLIHLVQSRFGFVSKEAISWIADKLAVEPIKVESVVTFYPGIRQSAPGKYHIRLCRTLSCAMAGAYELMEHICELANIDYSNVSHQQPIAVSPCGYFSVEYVECLASCGSAPVCLVNDELHENITKEEAPNILKRYHS